MRGIQQYRMILTVVATLLLAVGCSDEPSTPPLTTMLSIYVYSPDQPLSTRADAGDVTAFDVERQIRSLQIWVFRSDNGALVAYYSPTSTATLNSSQGEAYEVAVSDAFAREKPDVDVYVVANIAEENVGRHFEEGTTRAELDAALVGHDASGDRYGVTSLTTAVPTAGLPMTGVLKNQPVTGESPVLRIGTLGELATVQLVRTVSKVRFVFSNATSNPEKVDIRRITLNADVVPTQEYLFLDGPYTGRNTRLGTAYEPAADVVSESLGEDVARNTNPRLYIYTNQTAQEYEALINRGVNAKPQELTQCGPYYLRESDRKLAGQIVYAIDGEEKVAPFSMQAEGDFSRNHSWIVYAYFYGGDALQLVTSYVRGWNEETVNHGLHNW